MHRLVDDPGDHLIRAGLPQLVTGADAVDSDNKPEPARDGCADTCDGIFEHHCVAGRHRQPSGRLGEHRRIRLARE